MDPVNGTPGAGPIVTKISITDGAKHVVLIMDDLAAIAEVAATLAGKPEIAGLISNVSKLADAALAGYADSSLVEINAQNIAALSLDVQLLPPDDSAAVVEPPTPVVSSPTPQS